MQECKSIEATDSGKTQLAQERKAQNGVRRSNPPCSDNPRSIAWQLSRLMKECKSCEVIGSHGRQIHQDPKPDNRVQMSNSKDADNGRNITWKWFQPMQEYRLIEVPYNAEMNSRKGSKE
jgi:hypothetical protein